MHLRVITSWNLRLEETFNLHIITDM